uniref:Histone PARylation factor 1 n=1 Tax=Propithecus coquereli TaxID=379532 RepID=A0A2K6EFC0_PROCO
ADVKKSKSCEADVSSELRKEVENHYKLSFPEDFYHFWKFCEELDPEKPAGELLQNDSVSGKESLPGNWTEDMNSSLKRNILKDPPLYNGISYAIKNHAKLFLMKKLKEVTDKKKVNLLKHIDEKLTEAARELGYSLEQKTVKMKQRDKKVVTKTFHGAGLVVPVDKNDVGYRELPETDAALKRICKIIVEAASDEERLKAFAPIQEMMTFVQFANDECDYGMGLELGMDLFCYGSHYFHKVAGQLLPLAYTLLKRNLYAEIIEDHLANRSKENIDQLAA